MAAAGLPAMISSNIGVVFDEGEAEDEGEADDEGEAVNEGEGEAVEEGDGEAVEEGEVAGDRRGGLCRVGALRGRARCATSVRPCTGTRSCDHPASGETILCILVCKSCASSADSFFTSEVRLGKLDASA